MLGADSALFSQACKRAGQLAYFSDHRGGRLRFSEAVSRENERDARISRSPLVHDRIAHVNRVGLAVSLHEQPYVLTLALPRSSR